MTTQLLYLFTYLLGRIACTKCQNAAYCYRCFVPCVRLSVCLSVGHSHELCLDGGPDRHVVRRVWSVG